MNESLYKCESIIRQIEALADANDGEVTDDQLAELVRAQTTSLDKLGSLCGFIKHLEAYIAFGESEMKRINGRVDQAKNRLASVRGYLTPYVDEQRRKLGRPLDVDTFRLSTRHSTQVVITDDETFKAGGFPGESITKTTHVPDKKAIKDYIAKHKSHPGAVLKENVSLQLK